MAYLEEAALRSVMTRYHLFMIESVRATDRVGRERGAEPFCSTEEEAFMATVEHDLIADRLVSPADVGRLQALFYRGGGAPYPTVGDLKWLGDAVRLLDAVSASMKEHGAREAT